MPPVKQHLLGVRIKQQIHCHTENPQHKTFTASGAEWNEMRRTHGGKNSFAEELEVSIKSSYVFEPLCWNVKVTALGNILPKHYQTKWIKRNEMEIQPINSIKLML